MIENPRYACQVRIDVRDLGSDIHQRRLENAKIVKPSRFHEVLGYHQAEDYARINRQIIWRHHPN